MHQSSSSSSSSPPSWVEELAIYFRQQRTIPIPRWITPSHQTISLSEILGHSSFVLVAISYAETDFLMLRYFAVVGSTAMLFFTYFHPHGRVLWLPLKWNALFIAINTYRIAKVYVDRHNADNLPPEYMALRDEHFHLMDPVDFAKLVRLGKVEHFDAGDVLVAQDQDNQYVRLVISGELEALRNDKLTYRIEEASFVSESGLHAGIMLPGTVRSCCQVRARTPAHVLAWDRTQLLHLLESDAHVHRSLQNAMSWDIVRKLKEQRQLIPAIDDPEDWTQRRNEQSQHRYTAILQSFLEHPRLLNKGGRDRLHNYRLIHHIDEEHHLRALQECGWTDDEFLQGYKHGQVVTTGDDYWRRDVSWYWKQIYMKFFG